MRKGIVGPEIKGLNCSKRTVSTSYFKGPGLFQLEKTKKTVLMFWDKKRDVWFEGVHVTKIFSSQAISMSLAVQSMCLHAPCRLCTHKECIKTKILYNQFST